MLTDVGDAAELGDDHACGGVVFVLVLQRQDAGAEQFAQVVDRQAAVDKQRPSSRATTSAVESPPPPWVRPITASTTSLTVTRPVMSPYSSTTIQSEEHTSELQSLM